MQPGEAIAERGAADGTRVEARVFCPRCTANLSALPDTARFCNRCGFALPERLPQPPVVAEGIDDTPDATVLPDEAYQPPLILLAYAKALFNLGNRYETAIGSRRNVEEAARCYWKAARLGDTAARERVAARPTDPSALPYRPQGVPLPASLIVRDPAPPFADMYRPGVH